MSHIEGSPLLEQNQVTALRALFTQKALSADTSRGFQLASIKIAYVIERLNKVFGLCGIGWCSVQSTCELLE